MEADEIKPGIQVRYVPPHAEGNSNHPACETGIVMVVRGDTAFVRYFRNSMLQNTPEATKIEMLVRWGTPLYEPK